MKWIDKEETIEKLLQLLDEEKVKTKIKKIIKGSVKK